MAKNLPLKKTAKNCHFFAIGSFWGKNENF